MVPLTDLFGTHTAVYNIPDVLLPTVSMFCCIHAGLCGTGVYTGRVPGCSHVSLCPNSDEFRELLFLILSFSRKNSSHPKKIYITVLAKRSSSHNRILIAPRGYCKNLKSDVQFDEVDMKKKKIKKKSYFLELPLADHGRAEYSATKSSSQQC